MASIKIFNDSLDETAYLMALNIINDEKDRINNEKLDNEINLASQIKVLYNLYKIKNNELEIIKNQKSQELTGSLTLDQLIDSFDIKQKIMNEIKVLYDLLQHSVVEFKKCVNQIPPKTNVENVVIKDVFNSPDSKLLQVSDDTENNKSISSGKTDDESKKQNSVDANDNDSMNESSMVDDTGFQLVGKINNVKSEYLQAVMKKTVVPNSDTKPMYVTKVKPLPITGDSNIKTDQLSPREIVDVIDNYITTNIITPYVVEKISDKINILNQSSTRVNNYSLYEHLIEKGTVIANHGTSNPITLNPQLNLDVSNDPNKDPKAVKAFKWSISNILKKLYYEKNPLLSSEVNMFFIRLVQVSSEDPNTFMIIVNLHNDYQNTINKRLNL